MKPIRDNNHIIVWLIMVELNRVNNSLKEIIYSERNIDDKYLDSVDLINTLQPEIYNRLLAAEKQEWKAVPDLD